MWRVACYILGTTCVWGEHWFPYVCALTRLAFWSSGTSLMWSRRHRVGDIAALQAHVSRPVFISLRQGFLVEGSGRSFLQQAPRLLDTLENTVPPPTRPPPSPPPNIHAVLRCCLGAPPKLWERRLNHQGKRRKKTPSVSFLSSLCFWPLNSDEQSLVLSALGRVMVCPW